MNRFKTISQQFLFYILILILSIILSSCAARDLSYEDTVTDPSGQEITVPDEINSIAVLAPSLVETVVDMGQGDKIIAYDTDSKGLDGLKEDAEILDIMSPDVEKLVELKPDVLLVTNLTYADQPDAFQPLIDAGTTVVTVPTAESIDEIKEDITFLGTLFGEEDKSTEIINTMESEIDKIKSVGEGIKDKKTVYFEISPAPDMYSFGSNVYLDEMLNIIGANNILENEDGWIGVTEEAVVSGNPDVILSNFDANGNPVTEILARPGWNNINAVKNGQVYYIDNMSSSLPNENIVKALKEMAKAIYPEYYSE